MDSPPHPPTASVVIPAYKAPDYLDVTLRSIMPQAAAAGAEVIVVSDGPDPANTEVAERHGAQLITLETHAGLNTARNTGIDAARGDLIVFIDQDIDAPDGWLAALIAGAAAHPELEVFGGPIRARLEAALPACGRHAVPITTLDAGPADCYVPMVWGANMTMRRSAFERVGLFDPSLLGRGDEEEWLMRYQAAGGRIRYLAAAGLDHRRTAADSRLSVLAKAAYGQGREIRHHDRRSGKARSIPAELRTLAGCAWHTVRRRCAYGIVMGARTAGTLREALAERRG
jgi:glycosyltransferase involved in cell wall biosynthesis